MPSRIRSTELERCVLGYIAQLQPCTAYAVRKALGESLSSYWSSSAGSIYPLLDRLADRGWIRVREDAFGSRVRRRYSLLARGRREIQHWISAPVPRDEAAHTYDPLRTPVFFMDLVEPEARRRYLEDAEARTLQNLDLHREDLRQVRSNSSPWEILGREGAIAELEARLSWIRKGLQLG